MPPPPNCLSPTGNGKERVSQGKGGRWLYRCWNRSFFRIVEIDVKSRFPLPYFLRRLYPLPPSFGIVKTKMLQLAAILRVLLSHLFRQEFSPWEEGKALFRDGWVKWAGALFCSRPLELVGWKFAGGTVWGRRVNWSFRISWLKELWEGGCWNNHRGVRIRWRNRGALDVLPDSTVLCVPLCVISGVLFIWTGLTGCAV